MQNFVELLKDHALILSATRSLTAITRSSAANSGAAFASLRQLARLLDSHLRTETEFIKVEHHFGKGDFSALAEAHSERFDDLVAEWSTYLLEWTEDNIREDWATFAAATDWMVKRLEEQVETENELLYPAALRYGLIRLLPEKHGAPVN
ncbi:MAG: hypothetical protein J7498_09985 [Sphingobium sp.]|nr:hypothetical protein [Sphingobium sp.]